jgi:biopolymer transport protein ExbB
MHALDIVLNFFREGGFFLYPIALVWVIGLVIAFERFGFIVRVGAGNRAMWSQVQPLLEGGKFREALSAVSNSETALAHIMRYGITRIQTARRRDDIEKALEESLVEVIPRLEKRTHYIATFANVITLVGLLGTIIGLIKGFTAVAQVNPAEKAEMLSASISIAMNNTAFALMVAIPFLLIHSFLQAKTSEIVDGLEAAKISFLNLVGRVRADHAPAAAAR